MQYYDQQRHLGPGGRAVPFRNARPDGINFDLKKGAAVSGNGDGRPDGRRHLQCLFVRGPTARGTVGYSAGPTAPQTKRSLQAGPLPAGTYQVYVYDYTNFYVAFTGDPFSLADGQDLTEIDFPLARTDRRAGRITTAAGNPDEGCLVSTLPGSVTAARTPGAGTAWACPPASHYLQAWDWTGE